MEIYLLRHGTSIANERQLVCGASDYPLSINGLKQAKNICAHLADVSFSRIYTSPLSRARNTILQLSSDILPELVNEIKELDTGDVSHITLKELWNADSRFRRPWLTPDLRYPGGESFREMVERIDSWYKKILKNWLEHEKVLIVGHEGTLRSIYLNILNMELKNYPDFSIGNCDYLYFKILGGKICEKKHVKYLDVI